MKVGNSLQFERTHTRVIWQLVDTRSFGGIERHVGILAAALREIGLATEVVCYAHYGDNPWLRQLAAGGVPVRMLAGSPSSLLAALREARPALLHTHGYKAGILGRVAAALSGIPCVSTFHAGESGPFPLWAYQSLDAWTSFLARRIAVTDSIARKLPFRATVVPNFVAVPPRSRSDPPPPRVAFVGRFSHEKGPDLFCALARLIGPTFAYDCYGDGPMASALSAEYGALIRFHGFVEPERIWPQVGLLVMPSRAEGLPMAALEAMAAGVPVAASRVGGLPGLIRPGQNGWLFDVGDLSAAAEIVKSWGALDAQQRLALTRSTHACAIEFSVARHLPEVLAVYAAAGLESVRSMTTNVQSS
jgi:glycosyltransferase involved in cell wall biosynthesis